MKISMSEVARCLLEQSVPEKRVSGPGVVEKSRKMETSRPSSDDPEVNAVVDLVKELPDIRTDVVAALLARIEAGEYVVDENEVADLMLRRALADRIR